MIIMGNLIPKVANNKSVTTILPDDIVGFCVHWARLGRRGRGAAGGPRQPYGGHNCHRCHIVILPSTSLWPLLPSMPCLLCLLYCHGGHFIYGQHHACMHYWTFFWILLKLMAGERGGKIPCDLFLYERGQLRKPPRALSCPQGG